MVECFCLHELVQAPEHSLACSPGLPSSNVGNPHPSQPPSLPNSCQKLVQRFGTLAGSPRRQPKCCQKVLEQSDLGPICSNRSLHLRPHLAEGRPATTHLPSAPLPSSAECLPGSTSMGCSFKCFWLYRNSCSSSHSEDVSLAECHEPMMIDISQKHTFMTYLRI
jgi:hypothetical protein